MVDQSEDCILLVLLSLAECTQQTICVQIGTLLHYSRSSPSFTGPSVLGDPTFKRNVTIATYLGLNCNFVWPVRPWDALTRQEGSTAISTTHQTRNWGPNLGQHWSGGCLPLLRSTLISSHPLSLSAILDHQGAYRRKQFQLLVVLTPELEKLIGTSNKTM